MSITAVYFDNISYFRDTLPDHAISLLTEKVNNIKENLLGDYIRVYSNRH